MAMMRRRVRRYRTVPTYGIANARLRTMTVALTSADTDYDVKLPNGTLSFGLHRRDDGVIRLYDESAGS